MALKATAEEYLLGAIKKAKAQAQLIENEIKTLLMQRDAILGLVSEMEAQIEPEPESEEHD